MSYYGDLVKIKKMMNSKAKQNGPDEDNEFLKKRAPMLVREYKRSKSPALSPKDVAIKLEERNKISPTLAQQAVEMWYDHV